MQLIFAIISNGTSEITHALQLSIVFKIFLHCIIFNDTMLIKLDSWPMGDCQTPEVIIVYFKFLRSSHIFFFGKCNVTTTCDVFGI